MKKIINRNDSLAKKIFKEVEKNRRRFLEELKEEMPKIEAITTLKPEKGLRKFNI